MMSVTRPRARLRTRSALVSAVTLLLLTGAAGCDSGDDLGGGPDGSPASHAADVPDVTTQTTIERGEGMNAAHQAKVVDGVTAVIDPWFDKGFLGDFPRSDFGSAFAGFSPGAAQDAQRDLDLLSNSSIADQIDSATATNRRVRLEVFSPEGRPRGVTANFILDFTTKGDLEETLRVHGALYIAKDNGEWKVFGYDVDQAVQL